MTDDRRAVLVADLALRGSKSSTHQAVGKLQRMAVRFRTEGFLKADSRAAFESLAGEKAAVQEQLRHFGAIHPIARLVWDDLAMSVEFEFEIAHLKLSDLGSDDPLDDRVYPAWDEALARADEIGEALATTWWESPLVWESGGVSLADSQELTDD